VIPTGGIDGNNAAAYLEAGAVAVGVGGWLTGHSDMSMVAERAARLADSARVV
jgi:2-keto-3-deoxy-6-phosphogluconate aldolase